MQIKKNHRNAKGYKFAYHEQKIVTLFGTLFLTAVRNFIRHNSQETRSRLCFTKSKQFRPSRSLQRQRVITQ